MKEIIPKYFKYLLFIALIAMPIFGHMDTLPLRAWDESRLAMNAYEMQQNGNIIVTHYKGKPDMWNTKPPLMIWAQAFCMKLIGVNEIAVRLPSSLAALFTCIAFLIFAVRYLKDYWFGFIAVLVLITCEGYIGIHAVRTGDYDALLTLFTTLSGLVFFSFIETKKVKYLYLVFLFTAFAVLTKSITGLLFLPAMAIYAFLRKEAIPLFKNKHFYFGILGFIGLIFSYYLLRELMNPGFLQAVYDNELGGRFMDVTEGHQQGFWYYFKFMTNFQLSFWYLLIPCGILLGFLHKDVRINRITLFSSLMALCFFLVISSAQTKLKWYSIPLFPYLALLVAVFIHYIFTWFKQLEWTTQTLRFNLLPYFFLFFIALIPYRTILDKSYFPKDRKWETEEYVISYYLKKALREEVDLNGYRFLQDGYIAPYLFYIKMLQEKGVNIYYKDYWRLSKGDLVLIHQASVKDYIESRYDYEKVSEDGKIIRYKILSNHK